MPAQYTLPAGQGQVEIAAVSRAGPGRRLKGH